jgi:hypothetical protein
MCFAFSPQQAKRRLAAAVLRGSIAISNPETLDQPIAEPICFQGVLCSARFSDDGTKLLTVSGPFWDALDAVRYLGCKPARTVAGPRLRCRPTQHWLHKKGRSGDSDSKRAKQIKRQERAERKRHKRITDVQAVRQTLNQLDNY